MTELESSRTALRQRDRRAWRMGGALVMLVLTFDFLSVFAPAFMGAPLLPGAVAGPGIYLAVFIMFAVIGMAIACVRLLNREEAHGAARGDSPPGP